MIVDLTQLSQEQQWGVAFATKQFNEGKEDEDKITPQQYADMVMSQAADSYYAQLEKFKKDRALEIVDQMPQEQKDALLNQLGVPDVL